MEERNQVNFYGLYALGHKAFSIIFTSETEQIEVKLAAIESDIFSDLA